MHGNFPAILTDEIVGKEATKLYNDANALLDTIIAEQWLQPKGAIGFWPAESEADTVTLQVTDGNETKQVALQFLRQQIQKTAGQPNLSLADFIKPASISGTDYLGAFAVTIHGIESHIKAFEANHDDYNKIMLQALADRLARSFCRIFKRKSKKKMVGLCLR